MGDLFDGLLPRGPSTESLAEGATLLRGFAIAEAADLIESVKEIAAAAPFRKMVTPVDARCRRDHELRSGGLGDRPARLSLHPVRPDYPATMAADAGDLPDTRQPLGRRIRIPEFRAGCLSDQSLRARARLMLHQDKNERDYTQPIVTVSLGPRRCPLFGGPSADRPRRVRGSRAAALPVRAARQRLFFPRRRSPRYRLGATDRPRPLQSHISPGAVSNRRNGALVTPRLRSEYHRCRRLLDRREQRCTRTHGVACERSNSSRAVSRLEPRSSAPSTRSRLIRSRRSMCGEVLVVGGGPARVGRGLLADGPASTSCLRPRARYPRDKTCGDGLRAEAIAEIRSMGVDVEQLGAGQTSLGTHMGPGRRPASCGPPTTPGNTGEANWVLPRRVLDAALARDAAVAGARLVEGCRILRGNRNEASGWVVDALSTASRRRSPPVSSCLRPEPTGPTFQSRPPTAEPPRLLNLRTYFDGVPTPGT